MHQALRVLQSCWENPLQMLETWSPWAQRYLRCMRPWGPLLPRLGAEPPPAPVVLIVALALGKRKLTGDLSPPIAGRWPWQPGRSAVSLQVCGYDGGGEASSEHRCVQSGLGCA